MDPKELSQNANIPNSSQAQSMGVDPRLLAHTLENSWENNVAPSQQLLQQKLEQSVPAPSTSTTTTPLAIDPKDQPLLSKSQNVHGFFRTLTLIALLLVGVLMLLEELKIFSLTMDRLDMNMFYPIFVILSVIVIWSYKGIFGKIFGLLMFLSVVGGSFIIGVYTSLNPTVSNATGNQIAYPLYKNHPYSKIYLSTLINSLDVGVTTSSTGLFMTKYDIQRPLLTSFGTGSSGHDYVILQESDNINLLQGVYTRMQVGLAPIQPLYLYIKTFLGQNNLNLSQLNVRSLRIHGGIVALDVVFGDSTLISTTDTLINTGVSMTGTTLSGTKLAATGSSSKTATGSKLTTGSVAADTKNTLVIADTNHNIHVDLQAAVGDVTLHIPKDMGVRMKYKSYLGKTDLPGFVQNNGIYESANSKTAKKILNIDALFGLSRLTILQDR